MTRQLLAATLLCLLIAATGNASAGTKLDKRVDSATAVLNKFTQIPEQGIPPTLLRNAHAVAVIPGLIKAGFWLGGSYGKGILVVRREDGRWSNPTFISMGAGSFGPQIGAQSTDIILVFKSRKSVDKIASGQFQLGGDATVAAGPVGRQTSASTNLSLKAEVYSYARSRGLFAGISLEGAVIGMDNKSNFAYYQDGNSDAQTILNDPYMPAPMGARQFVETLSAKAPRIEAPGSRSAAYIAPAEPAPPSGATTYGLDEAPAPEADTVF